MRNIVKSIFVIILFINCTKKTNTATIKYDDLINVEIEKIIIINLDEVCLTYFKLKIDNPSIKRIILQDNSIVNYFKNQSLEKETGFYLKNTKNEEIIPLGYDNYGFMVVAPESNNSFFLAGKNLSNSYTMKDSIKFKSYLSNFEMRYDGSTFDLDSIKKNKYISNSDFNNFKKNKSTYFPYKKGIIITIPYDLKIKYINELPITEEDWNKL